MSSERRQLGPDEVAVTVRPHEPGALAREGDPPTPPGMCLVERKVRERRRERWTGVHRG
ncbi:MAG TPA: hypothetical protein VMW48_00505 [Vicinamibacterales bacterium]|nr:hypothetical protein [Vicinamibacterales bacterium]